MRRISRDSPIILGERYGEIEYSRSSTAWFKRLRSSLMSFFVRFPSNCVIRIFMIHCESPGGDTAAALGYTTFYTTCSLTIQDDSAMPWRSLSSLNAVFLRFWKSVLLKQY